MKQNIGAKNKTNIVEKGTVLSQNLQQMLKMTFPLGPKRSSTLLHILEHTMQHIFNDSIDFLRYSNLQVF